MVTCGACGGENDVAATRCATCGASISPRVPVVPAVAAVLDETTRRVAPGEEAVFSLGVRNTGSVADRFALEVMGIPAAWATFDPQALDLPPGGSASATIRLRPPGGSEGPTGSVDFGIAVRPATRPDAAAIELGVLEIEPAAEPAAEAVTAPPWRGRVPPMLNAVATIALVAVAVAVIAVGASVLGPGSSPAAIVPSAPAVTPTPGAGLATPATPSPAGSPTAAPTLEPVPPSRAPGAPVAWWQDAYDAATAAGIALGPAVAEGTTDDNLPYAEFANGAIVQRVYDAHWVSDDIWRAWKAVGGGPGPGAIVGYPTSGLLGPDLVQRRQLFDDGAIYWTAATGAHIVSGPVWAWWRSLVAEQGGDVERPGESGLVDPLGLPTSDVRSDTTGAWIELENGLIGVTAEGARWVCVYAGPAGGFPSCTDVEPAPATPVP